MKLALFLSIVLVAGTLLASCSSDPAGQATTAAARPKPLAPGPATARQGLVEAVQLMLHRLDTLRLTGNRDQDFALIMAVHHRTALRLARTELERGHDSTLLAVARSLRTNQQQEMQQLQLATARLDNPAPNYSPRNAHDAFVRRNAAALDTLLQPIGALHGSIDQDFAALLRAHHQAAVLLAQTELALGHDGGMKQLAHTIVAAKKAQLSQLRRWQKTSRR